MTARLHVLCLPSIGDGDRHEPPFALVAERAGDLAESDREALRAFASELGAQGCLVLSSALDVPGEDDESDAQLTEAMGEQLRMLAMPAPQPSGQKPNLPPPNTTEGKLARVLGGQKVLGQMRDGDPL